MIKDASEKKSPWYKLAGFILKFRVPLLILLLALTGIMGWYASRVEISYEFTNAIPTSNPKYQQYQDFRKQFGEDGNTMVIGVKTDSFFSPSFFKAYTQLVRDLKKVPSIQGVLSVPTAVYLTKDTATKKLKAVGVFKGVDAADIDEPITDSSLEALLLPTPEERFKSLPFYRGSLYNPETGTYLMAVRIDKKILNSAGRVKVVQQIVARSDSFGKQVNTEMHYSGLPMIRTTMATQVQSEMRLFILLSFALTALILAIFFRSWVAVFSSMLVVGIAVVWTLGSIKLFGFQLSLLTGIIPSLIVVIGIPNCVYFLNKYHTEYAKHGNKREALLQMVNKMGIITLFTNLTAAIGFGVFAFTKSVLLQEFGLITGINLIAIFFVSLILLPVLFSYLPAPRKGHTSYLDSRWIVRLLTTLTNWTFSHRPWIYGITIVSCAVAIFGITRLHSEGHIVDDLPKGDKVYQDLKFFETNFHGVMPLEIVIADTSRKNSMISLPVLEKLDQVQQYMKSFPEVGSALSIASGVKFANQAYNDGDSAYYTIPDQFGAIFLQRYLRPNKDDTSGVYNQLISSFMDSSRTKARISINIADIGSVRLPMLIDSIRTFTNQVFDTTKYHITYTGTSVVFLEGSSFIIHSLRDSLLLAFLMIFVCLMVLFRSWRIVLISFVVNVVPLLITAGIMGFAGVALKPSTVLVFSIALGITVDVTIRFLVSFRQDFSNFNGSIADTVRHTIQDTGLSIIYTSLILIAGFGVFILSHFDGTKNLGYLTSLTLLLAMITNLTLQPALLLWMEKAKLKKKKNELEK